MISWSEADQTREKSAAHTVDLTGLHAQVQAENGETSSLLMALYYLEHTLDEETALLSRFDSSRTTEFSSRKTRVLLELNRLLLPDKQDIKTSAIVATLRRLSMKLHMNADLLKTRLDATREVASLITKVIRDADSDGTYLPKQRMRTFSQ